VVASARLFILPTAAFVLAIATVIAIGLISGAPVHPSPASTQPATLGSVGVLLVLAAFANGCSALTGVEAIANATPAFQRPRQVRARHAEAALGLILGLLLIGLAVVVQRFHILPVTGRSLLSQHWSLPSPNSPTARGSSCSPSPCWQRCSAECTLPTPESVPNSVSVACPPDRTRCTPSSWSPWSRLPG
jgi:amino acid transporter